MILHPVVRIGFRLVFFGGLLAIVVLSLEPKPPDVLLRQGDLVIHFVGYGALGFSAAMGWPGRMRGALVVVPLIGLALEFGQIPVPGRGFDWMDALANACGATLGILVAWVLHRVFAGR